MGVGRFSTYPPHGMIRFLLVQNRQGKVRLAKYYAPFDETERARLPSETHRLVVSRDQRIQSNFVEVDTRCARPHHSTKTTELSTGAMRVCIFAHASISETTS